MGSTFPRRKVWQEDEDVMTVDLNAEFDEVLQNLTPSGIDDHSVSVSQMRVQTSPGDVGSESLATSSGGEFERLRYVIARALGKPFWYQSPALSLEEVNSVLESAVGIPPNRVVSGLTNGTSQQSLFLDPHGAALTVTLKASVGDPLVCFIDGTQYTFTSDIVLAGLIPAPNTNNTCAINDPLMAGERWTKLYGEQDSFLTIDAAGTEITNRVGLLGAFLNPNSGNEIFMARIKSATKLAEAHRGFFFDSTGAPLTRDVLSDNDVLTILKLSWLFLKTDGTLDVTYSEPVYAGSAPLTPSNGDYWFDQTNNTWKKFNGTAFVAANAVYVGISVQDTTACIAARSVDFFKICEDSNSIRIRYASTTSVESRKTQNTANVFGNKLVFNSPLIWNYPTDLASGLSAADGDWFFYLKETGDVVISDEYPYDRNSDLKGWYHPHETWLCVGGVSVGREQAGKLPAVTGTFDPWTMICFGAMKPNDVPGQIIQDMNFYDTSHYQIRDGYIPLRFDLNFFASRYLLFRAWQYHKNATGDASDITDSEQFALPAVDGYFFRSLDVGGALDPDYTTRTAYNAGGNAGALPGSVQPHMFEDHTHPTGLVAVAVGPLQSGNGYGFNTGTAITGNFGAETRPSNIYVSLWFKY